MFKRFSLTALVLALAATLGGPAPSLAEQAPDTAAPASATEPDRPPYVEISGRRSTHEKGKVKLTVFMDFLCSHCHHFDTVVLPVLEKEYGNKLVVEYVGVPLVDPQASHIPVLAYYLAVEQGKGKAMREALFSTIWDLRMDVTRPDILLGVAAKAGLDLEAFKSGFNGNRMQERMEQGMRDAKAINLRGTPTLLIDNHIKINDNSLRNVEAVIGKVLGKGA
ncbi:MAG: DsbA family protein [Nitrospirae bacterium]|nr:DsbA family protein [Nitrospirota bacterium]